MVDLYQSPANQRLNNLCKLKISDGKEEDEVDRNGPLSFTLTDPDILDCPICIHPLTKPVYQCENGHISCSSCCSRILSKRCPSCSRPIGQIRCRAIEMVIESLEVECRYKRNGCKERLQYIKKQEHLSMCTFSPHYFQCPLPSCDFGGSYSALKSHIRGDHNPARTFHYDEYFFVSFERNQRCVILRCEDDEDYGIYVLYNFSYFNGNTVNVSRVAPSEIFKPCYDLTTAKGLLSLHSSADCIQKKVNRPHGKKTLLVPNGSQGSQLHARVRISRIFCGQRHLGTL